MVDNLTPTDPGMGAEAAPKRGFAALAASGTGRIILGVLGLVLLLGIAAAIYFLAFSGAAPAPTSGGVVPPQGTTGSQGASASVVPTEPAPVPNDDVFTFRDIFEHTVKPPATSTAGSGGSTTTPSGSGGGTPDTGSNTIYIQSTGSEDGREVATLLYNGQTYVVGEGDQVDSSPWQVLRIDGETVVMLYGDTQVTLTVGQGITK